MRNPSHPLLRAGLVLALVLPAASCRTGPLPKSQVAVTVDVDFGLADHAPRTSQVLVPEGSSPIDAVASFLEVERGFVCCTKGDLWSVDGVATDPATNHYWIWRLNGHTPSLAPDRYDLQNGDHVAWVFTETEKPVHRRN